MRASGWNESPSGPPRAGWRTRALQALRTQIAHLIHLHQARSFPEKHHRPMETKEPMSILPQLPRVSPPSFVTEYVSRGDVARLFGVSLSTVTRWARTGLVPTVRTPGGHY